MKIFIPSAPLVHISGFIIISLLVCSVSVQSHRTWSTVSPVSQKGHYVSVIPFIRGPWVALIVYPVLSLEITTCSLLVMPLVSPSYSSSIFLPFLHHSFLIFVVSVFNHFSRSFGEYSSICCPVLPLLHHLLVRFRVYAHVSWNPSSKTKSNK
jgi:hypothetical protein